MISFFRDRLSHPTSICSHVTFPIQPFRSEPFPYSLRGHPFIYQGSFGLDISRSQQALVLGTFETTRRLSFTLLPFSHMTDSIQKFLRCHIRLSMSLC